MSIEALAPQQAELVLDVLCESFHDYPVMRFVLGSKPGYDRRLRVLVGLFVAARVARADLMLGAPGQDGRLLGAALVNLPGNPQPADWFEARREATWAELGAEERARYEAYGTASHASDPTAPHHHLGMIGVRGAAQGTGLGRHLLEAVHRAAADHPESTGVSLTTELARNVPLYQHFGYRIVSHTRVAPALETWSMFRDRTA